MACSCTKKRADAESAAAATAPEVVVEIPAHAVAVREAGHPLACPRCLDKHVATAAVCAAEFAENRGRDAERLLCIANLACAEQHARALGRDSVADAAATAREAFAADGDAGAVRDFFRAYAGAGSGTETRLAAAGALARAEALLHLAGADLDAARVRVARLAFMFMNELRGPILNHVRNNTLVLGGGHVDF